MTAAAGYQIEAALEKAMKDHAVKYVLIVEGSVPLKDDGVYCYVGGKKAIDTLTRVAEKAAAVIAIGSCASWGGIPSASPNPTGAVGVAQALPGKTVVTLPGCPANPYNLLGTVLQFATFGTLPALDEKGRPKFAYGRVIHDDCPRRAHFDNGRFAQAFGDAGHREGWCLYKLGCKGPETYNNCSTLTFGDVGASSWPVGMGAPCFGCSEQGVGYTVGLHSPSRVVNLTPPAFFTEAFPGKEGTTPGTSALAAGVVGLAVGAAGVALLNSMGKTDGDEDGKGD